MQRQLQQVEITSPAQKHKLSDTLAAWGFLALTLALIMAFRPFDPAERYGQMFLLIAAGSALYNAARRVPMVRAASLLRLSVRMVMAGVSRPTVTPLMPGSMAAISFDHFSGCSIPEA